MAQSNRHWPSMFRSKPCTNQNHNQWQHDISSSLMCCKSSFSSVTEERSPEPKPRWNPKPEQIRILEAIFNSGMVNPPREEIRRIRAQLQEYGQVGDANVFYWFQNRKSRSKHKNRLLQASKAASQSGTTQPVPAPASSSSSSDKSPPRQDKALVVAAGTNLGVDASNSPTASVNQTCFSSSQVDFSHDGLLLQVQELSSEHGFGNGNCLSDYLNILQESGFSHCTGFLQELINQGPGKKGANEKSKLTNYNTTPATVSTAAITVNDLQGFADVDVLFPSGGGRSTVFINDVAFEVGAGPVNLREAFGDDAILVHSSGQPVPTNEWGVTLHSLQHGAFYYLVSQLQLFGKT